jgi:hypothetical protein
MEAVYRGRGSGWVRGGVGSKGARIVTRQVVCRDQREDRVLRHTRRSERNAAATDR